MKKKGKGFLLALAAIWTMAAIPVWAGGFEEVPAAESEFQEELSEEDREMPKQEEETGREKPSAEEIPLDEEHFPDAVFREIIGKEYDLDQNGSLSIEERNQVIDLDLDRDEVGEIYNLRGLAYFPELKRFRGSGLPVRELDMSGNPKLEKLYFVDIPDLQEFRIEENKKLRKLSMGGTKGLETLELRNFPELESVLTGEMERVILENLPALERFDDDWVKELQIIDCENLRYMEIWDNEKREGDFETLDLSGAPALYELTIHGYQQLKSIDFSHNPILTYVNIDYCGLEEVKIAEDGELARLEIGYNQIKSLDVSSEQIKVLDLNHNPIDSLDLSQFPNLASLNVNGTNIATLDLSPCKDTIKIIDCRNSHVKYLDISEAWKFESYDADAGCEVFGIKEPKLQKARLVKKDQVELIWEKDRTAHEYRIERKNLEGEWEELETRKSWDGTKFIQKVTPGRSYTYRVIARRVIVEALTDHESWFESTASEEGISTPTLFETPKMHSVIRTAKNTVKVKWKGVEGATKYRVYRRRAGGKVWRNMGDVKGTSFTDKKAPAGTSYCYTVKAYNENTKPAMISRYQLNGMEEVPGK